MKQRPPLSELLDDQPRHQALVRIRHRNRAARTTRRILVVQLQNSTAVTR